MAFTTSNHQVSMAWAFLALSTFGLLYTIILAIYRLYFSPIANFPGPKLAALTYWVETYYEVWKGEGGQFPNAYRKWHDTYGKKTSLLLLSPLNYNTVWGKSRKVSTIAMMETDYF
jgi:hypothetical protein